MSFWHMETNTSEKNNMADKKSLKSDDFTSLRAEKSENPSDFLARVGVTRQMQEVVSIILENRPDDPIAFIADYFANVSEYLSRVNRAYQYVCQNHHSNPSYENNLLKAYNVLIKQKCGQGLNGLVGKFYNELLGMICRDITSSESETLLNMLKKREQDVIKFNELSSGVTCCFLLKDYILQAKSLFEDFELSGKGHADYTLCVAMLSYLSKTVSQTNETSLSILEGAASFTAQNIDNEMKKALADSFLHNTGTTMSLDEFVHEAGKIFFTKIPTLKRYSTKLYDSSIVFL